MADITLSGSSNRQKNSLLKCPGPPIKSSPSHKSMPKHWVYLSVSPVPHVTSIPLRICIRSSQNAKKTIRSPSKTDPSPCEQLEPYSSSPQGLKLDKITPPPRK